MKIGENFLLSLDCFSSSPRVGGVTKLEAFLLSLDCFVDDVWGPGAKITHFFLLSLDCFEEGAAGGAGGARGAFYYLLIASNVPGSTSVYCTSM